ncbi:carbohydrate kinase [Pseudomonas sp. LTJR-52]|uniref:carbohydrate kinase family protein n=1 Tax=Pseudomonas sp. LTJR-52 TaxID=2479392 RepID=UPI000EFCFEDB|nr:carbohydrate kinase [Pseudomonas sp. LTJR-52]AYN96990.1 carbohydrate kinase [Pseudomonas sp. LTJR-52]
MFLVGGEALFDLFVEPQTSFLPSRVGLNAVAGGSPFNVAVGLSRLGIKAGLLTGLSTDYLGKQLRQVLQEEGVSTRYLVEVNAPTTLSMVTVNEQGSPHYSFYGEAGADRQLAPHHLPELEAEVRGVHVGSYSLVVQPTADALYQLVADASKERLITLDPNVRLNVEPDVGLWRKQIAAFAQHAHIIKVSEEDLELLYPNEAPAVVARNWLSNQCQWVLLTHGEKGVSVFTRNRGDWLHPGRPLTPVDTVGAGDTFQAAVIAFLTEQGLDHPASVATLEQERIEAMLAFACEAAALTCTRRGPDLPRRHELPVITANSWNHSTSLSQAV